MFNVALTLAKTNLTLSSLCYSDWCPSMQLSFIAKNSFTTRS